MGLFPPLSHSLAAPSTELTLQTLSETQPFSSAAPAETTSSGPDSQPSEQSSESKNTGIPQEMRGFAEKVPSLLPAPPKVPLSKGPRLSLNDCIQMALLNNKEIRAKDYDIVGAQARLQEAQPRGVPVFDYEFLSAPAPRDVDHAVSSFFSGDITYFQRGKLAFGIPLASFGKIKLAQELAKNGIDSEK
ncbi:MAG TPA: hypothetical protein DF383_08840, partial [Deltaproteobacteria bacterium]|nr:hypothetical protein [Deltaproteobacteria bacterium]